MDMLDLKNYRVRKEESYYERGYYLADIISMHRCFAALEGCSDEISLEKIDYIGCVGSEFGVEKKTDDVICYNPFALAEEKDSSDIYYIAAHEVGHIKNNDGFRIRTLRRLSVSLGICLWWIALYLCFPMVSLVPIVTYMIYWAGLREIETQADIIALKYNSFKEVFHNIHIREHNFWLFHDHATVNKFVRKLVYLSNKKKIDISDINYFYD